MNDNFITSLDSLPLNQIQTAFKWEFLMDMVARVYFSFAVETEKAHSLDSIIDASRRIGYIIKAKEISGENLHNRLSYWGIDLSRPHLGSAFNIPKENAEKYLKFKCKNYFYYCRGFIDNEYIEIIKENIYYRGISNSYYSMDKYEILYYLSVNCYLYYLAEKETTICVDSNIKASARDLLEDQKVVNINEYLFFIICDRLEKYDDLEQDLQDMMSGCEWFPKYDNGKTLIMESVVREFYVFVQLYLNCNYRFREQNNFPISEEPIKYIMQFLDGNEENTKKNIKIFLKLFSTENISADDLLSNLETYLKSIYKNKCINEAAREQRNYIDNIDENAVANSLQNILEKSFKDTFENIPFNETDETVTWINTFNLINYNLFTDMINENVIDNSILSDIYASFVINVINELLKKKLIKHVTRTTFKSDGEFLDYIKGNQHATLIGAEYVFKNSDYKNTSDFNAVFERMNCIFYGYYKSGGILLRANSFKLKIKKVNIKIGSVTLSDIDYTADENGEILSYKVTNNIIIPFPKNELIEYLKNKRKMLSISVEAEFSVNGNDIGSLITRNDI